MPLRQQLRAFITGSDAAAALPQDSRRNLYWYWFDGLFAAASDTTPINYLTLYFLALHATPAQIGWFSSFSSLAAALCLLPGAFVVEKYGKRKEFTVAMGGLLARIMLLTMALAPLGLNGQPLIWAVIIMGIVRVATGNLAFPAWMSMTGDIVPQHVRGRYFGSRNFVMIIAGIVVTYLIGEFITRVGSESGYQIALLLSFATGMISTWFFAQIKDPQNGKPAHSDMSLSPKEIWNDLHGSPAFMTYCAISAFWNFSHSIAGPFFNVYMRENLGFTAAMIGITANAVNITKLLTQHKIGELTDHWGSARMQMLSMLTIPILPFLWLFASELWHIVGINLLGGILWGGFELASFNLLLVFTPEDKRARYSAIYQIIVMLAMAAGAAVGSSIIDTAISYKGTFLVSFIGRIMAAVCFVYFLRKSSFNQVQKA